MEGLSSAAPPPDTEDGPSKLTIKACDSCRKKKIRCDVIGESCANCIKNNTPCIFTPIKTNKGPRRPPGYKHVEELEKRLKSVESILQAQNSIPVPHGNVQKDYQTGIEYLGKKRKASRTLLAPSESQISPIRTRRQSSRISTRSIPDSFSHTQQSPNILRGIYSPEENESLNDILASGPYWKVSPISNLFIRRTIVQLPAKDDARLLIQDMFKSFNASSPLFDQASFLNTFEARYPANNGDDPGWCASLNVVFALAHRFRAMKRLNSQSEDGYSWGYLQNALALVTELTMLKPDILSVQAIIGIVIVLQATPYPQPCSTLLAVALKLAHRIKLHRRDQGPGLTAAETEQRKRVFWLAYISDKDNSLRTGDPPAQDEDEMDVELPAETIDLNLACTGNVELPAGTIDMNLCTGNVSFFNLRIGLAIIQGQIYKRLLSTKALRQSEVERSHAATELGFILDDWKRSVSVGFESDKSSIALGASSLPDVLDKAVTQLTYFGTLDAIHSSILVGSPAESTEIPQSPIISFPSRATCIIEARKSLELVQMMPLGDYACVWYTLHYFFSAATTILSYAIKNPDHPLASEDLRLVEPVLHLLNSLKKNRSDSDVSKMAESLEGLFKQARVLVGDVKEHRSNLNSEETAEAENGNVNVKKDIKTAKDFMERIQSLSAARCREWASQGMEPKSVKEK